MSYCIVGNEVHYCNDLIGGGRSTRRIERADAASLHVFNRTWATDRRKVWANGYPVRKVDVASFRALNAAFGADATRVFDSLGRIVKDVDPCGFEVLDDGMQKRAACGCTDAGYARYEGKILHYEWGEHRTMWLRGADAESFRALIWNYGCDKRRAYQGRWLVKGADSASYRQITPFFAVDRCSVFYLNRAIPEIDPHTFDVFESGFWKSPDMERAAGRGGIDYWARDARWVVHQDRIVPDADPATAHLVGDCLTDGRGVFTFLGKKVEVSDVASFEAIGCGRRYFRDANYVYYDGTSWMKVPGADPKTFEELADRHSSRGDARDRNWIYRDGIQRRIRSDN